MGRKRGFTLIELLVVVAIIALLIAILIPSLSKARTVAKSAVCLSNLRSLSMSANLYVTEWNGALLPFSQVQAQSWTQLLQAKQGGTAKVRVCPEATNVASLTDPVWGKAHEQWANSPETGVGISASYGVNGWLYNAARTAGGDMGQLTTMMRGGALSDFYTWPLVRTGALVPTFADCNWRHVFSRNFDPGPLDVQNPGPNNDYDNHPMSRVCMDRHDRAVNVSFFDGHGEHVELQPLWTLAWSANWKPPAFMPTIR